MKRCCQNVASGSLRIQKALISLVLFPLCKSFPLHRCGGFAGHVIHHSVNVLDLVGDPVGDLCQKIVGDAGPVGGHEVVGGDGADGQEVVVGAVVAHDAYGADTGQNAGPSRPPGGS